MIAASVWSLLIPAIDKAEELGKIGWIPAAGGFVLGVAFLMTLDKLMPAFHPGADRPEGVKKSLGHSAMLVFAITLHNIPEGMAEGVAFALAARNNSKVLLAAAAALAVGMGIQNFPEGAAISLPLMQSGMSRTRAFVYGMLSGLVEPIFGILTVFIAGAAVALLPWLLSFAAGAMLYVVVEELIPEAKISGSHIGTFGTMTGFLIMMILDVALG
jgi:ZIP family zinc transporter